VYFRFAVINFKCTRLVESDQPKKRRNKDAECGGLTKLVTVVTTVPEPDVPQQEPQNEHPRRKRQETQPDPPQRKRYFLYCANNPDHQTLVPRDVDTDLLVDLLKNDLRLPDWYCQQLRALGIVDENGNFGIPCSFTLRTCELTRKCRKSSPSNLHELMPEPAFKP
jgi:hypothetical protein